MITLLTILLSLTIIGVGISYKEITKLQKRLDILHKETNNRISVTDQQIHLRINNEIETLHELIRQNEIEGNDNLKKQIDSLTKQIIKKIPPTNDKLMERMDKLEKDSYTYRMSQ